MPPRRRQAAHSIEAILDAAIDLLDRDGVPGLTLRGLAAHLGGGVGSVYWYVSGKDDLVNRAADAVIARALHDIAQMRAGRLDPADIHAAGEVTARRKATAAALSDVRRSCLALFHQIKLHPWVAPQLVADQAVAANSLRFWDTVGTSLMELALTPTEQFNASTGLVNYVTGVGAAMDANGVDPDDPRTRDEIMDDHLAQWSGTVPEDLRFVQSMFGELRRHNEFEQFIAGLDLMLAGLRQQIEAR